MRKKSVEMKLRFQVLKKSYMALNKSLNNKLSDATVQAKQRSESSAMVTWWPRKSPVQKKRYFKRLSEVSDRFKSTDPYTYTETL